MRRSRMSPVTWALVRVCGLAQEMRSRFWVALKRRCRRINVVSVVNAARRLVLSSGHMKSVCQTVRQSNSMSMLQVSFLQFPGEPA